MLSERIPFEAISPGSVRNVQDHMPVALDLTGLEAPKPVAADSTLPTPDRCVNVGDFDGISCTRAQSEPTLDWQQFQAVLYTSCFAQLYAAGIRYFNSDPDSEKKLFPIDVREHTNIWHQRYNRILPLLGWSTSSLSWQTFNGGQGRLRIIDIVNEILKDNASAEEIDAFESFVKSYESTLGDDPTKVDRFGPCTRVSQAADFAVSQAMITNNHVVSVGSVLVSLETTGAVNPVFATDFDRALTTVYAGYRKMDLNWVIYLRKQDWIINAVQGYEHWVIALDDT